MVDKLSYGMNAEWTYKVQVWTVHLDSLLSYGYARDDQDGSYSISEHGSLVLLQSPFYMHQLLSRCDSPFFVKSGIFLLTRIG